MSDEKTLKRRRSNIMGFLKELARATKEGSELSKKDIAERKKREAELERNRMKALQALWDDKHKNDKR